MNKVCYNGHPEIYHSETECPCCIQKRLIEELLETIIELEKRLEKILAMVIATEKELGKAKQVRSCVERRWSSLNAGVH